MSLTQRGFRSYDGNHAPDYVKNGNFDINKDSPQAQGLLLWYPNGNDRPKGKSLGPRSFDLTPTGTVFRISRFGDSALLFNNGASEKLQGTGSPPITTAPVTLTCWFSTDDIADQNQALGGLFTSTNAGRRTWWSAPGETDVLRFFSQNTETLSITTTNAVIPNKLQHGFVSLSAGGAGVAILDGDIASKGSGTNSNAVPTTIDRIGIGGLLDLTPADFFSGLIKDYRVYDRVLPEILSRHMWSPDTRWDLYYETGKVSYFFVPAVEAPDTIEIAPMLSPTPRWDRKVAVY